MGRGRGLGGRGIGEKGDEGGECRWGLYRAFDHDVGRNNLGQAFFNLTRFEAAEKERLSSFY